MGVLAPVVMSATTFAGSAHLGRRRRRRGRPAMTWPVVAVGVVTVAVKGAGPAVLGGRRHPARFAGVVGLFAPALLAGLVAVQVFADDRRLVLDARAAGLAAAAVALALRAPTIVVVVVAAATAAAVRAAAGG